MKTILTLLFALAAIVTLPAPEAQAQAPNAPPPPGHMRAAGIGTMKFKAAGRMEFFLHGKGVLVIRDASSKQIKLFGKGQVSTSAQGDLVIQGYKGKVEVKGKGISGVFSKGRIGVVADGKGAIKLKGKGVFKANGTPGKWAVPAAKVTW